MSFRRSSRAPSAEAPCTWKFLFEMSMPMMLTLSMGSSPHPLTAQRVRVFMAHRDAAERGTSTPSLAACNAARYSES